MGDLVLFRPRSNAAPDASAANRSESAEIVFFTGVRYERFEAPPHEAKRPPPRGGLNGAGRGKRKKRA
jgi:hypothetical protein